MLAFERRFLAHFAWRALLGICTLLAVGALFGARRLAGKDQAGLSWRALREFASQLDLVLSAGMLLAAPAAAAFTIAQWSRRGLLVDCALAGMTPRSWRRCLLAAAGAVSAIVAVQAEVFFWLRSPSSPQAVWRLEGGYLWLPWSSAAPAPTPGDPPASGARAAVAFRLEDLEVQQVVAPAYADVAALAAKLAPRFGAIAGDHVHHALDVAWPPLSGFWSAPADLAVVAATLLRIVLPALLLVVAGYAALCAPIIRPWPSLALAAMAVPVVGIAWVAALAGLWQRTPLGHAIAAATVVTLALLALGLGGRYRRRGPRWV